MKRNIRNVIDNPNYKFTGYRRVVESSFRVS